ncbi:cytochrome P450 [Xylaria sp. FL0064]|nr:cytochrome P450 [Xylaria sp. FL0064]
MGPLQMFTPAATWIVCAAIPYVIKCLALCIYRLFFHPLSRYPGPPIAKLSGFYGAYYASKTTLHMRTLQDHEQFGPVIRQGPNKLVFNSVNALREIYRNERITKSCAYLASQRGPDADYSLFSSIDRQMHQRKRKLCSPVLNDRAMRAFEVAMMSQIEIFLEGLFSACQQPATPVNMSEKLQHLTMDVAAHLVFGYPLNLQTDGAYRFMTDTTATFCLNIAPQLSFLSKARLFYFRRLRTLLRGKSYHHTLQKMIRNRLAKAQDAKHNMLFMTDTLRISDDDDTFVEECLSEGTFLLSAGSDTMSTCLSAVFFYLSKSPEVYRRLATEIRSAFTHSDEIKGGPRLAACSYLHACIDEALRMSPPVPGTLWRQQVTGNDTRSDPLVIDGVVIPPDTHIGVDTYALQHNEAYFPEPFVFKPERFLDKESPAARLAKDAFAPFSIGARGCLGKSMAYLETSLILAKTFWHFDFLQAPDYGTVGESNYWKLSGQEDRVDEYQINDIFGASHDGPCLIFKPRKVNTTGAGL